MDPKALSAAVCTQRIGDDPAKKPINARWARCLLPAHAWCFDCNHYVCEIHFTARHDSHRVDLTSD